VAFVLCARISATAFPDHYGRSSGFCIDPIEKKPLESFLSGEPASSHSARAGCNLGLPLCQKNWDQPQRENSTRLADQASPESIAAAARRLGAGRSPSLYNDPVIFAEYAMDRGRCVPRCRRRPGCSHCGYMTDDSRPEFYRHMDAANVDLKGFTEEFYHRNCFRRTHAGARHVEISAAGDQSLFE